LTRAQSEESSVTNRSGIPVYNHRGLETYNQQRLRIDNHNIITKGIILTNILGIITIQKGNLHQPTNLNGMTEGVLNTTQMGYSEPCCGRTKSCTSW